MSELTEKQIEIIDFINDNLLAHEVTAKKQIAVMVQEKYGPEGEEVWKMLEDDDEPIDMSTDICPDCGKISEEWIEKTKKQMEQFEHVLDDTYDDLIHEIIQEKDENNISNKYLREKIEKVLPEGKDIEIELSKLKEKILFVGILDGWLVDEYFK